MRKIIMLSVLCGILFTITGCITNNEFNFIERAIRKQIHPAHLKTNFKISFGPIVLSTAQMFVNFSEPDVNITELLSEIKKVQIGVFEIYNIKDNTKLTIPGEAEKRLTDHGWETFVRVRNKEEAVNLFYKQINNSTASIYAIVMQDNELVIVELKGHLDKVIQKAIREHGIPGSPALKI